MPRYDYDCVACGRRIEVVHGVYAPGPAHCPNCGAGPLKKAIAAPAVHFKGSGWAKRDRRATVAPGTSKAAGDSGGGADRPKGDKEGTTSSTESGSADRETTHADGPSTAPAGTAGATASTKTGA